MSSQELKVPDIGDFTDIPVIEILVKVGDTVAKEQSIVTLESDKATMEVPADVAGVIKELRVKLGDKCSMGTVVAVIETSAGTTAAHPSPPEGEAVTNLSHSAPGERGKAAVASQPTTQANDPLSPTLPLQGGGSLTDVKVPDIGDFSDIPVIEILVKVGDTVKVEQSLVTLESDKATMEVPSTVAGVVKEIKVKLGDKVSEGAVVVVVASAGAVSSPPPGGEGLGERVVAPAPSAAVANVAATPPPSPQPSPPGGGGKIDEASFSKAHASPSIRKFARELGVDLAASKPQAPKTA